MKINIGSGDTCLDGFINCDSSTIFNPEYVFNLETDIFPFEDNSVDEVMASHVLEHLGEGYFHCLKELYRVCANGAIIHVRAPHYRNECQYFDPTHRRPITEYGFVLFNKKHNLADSTASSKLGLVYDVDFQVISCTHSLYERHPLYDSLRKMTPEQLQRFEFDKFNIYSETRIDLKVIK